MRLPLKTYLFLIAMLCMPVTAWAGYDKPYVGEQKIYKAKYEDTLVHIARHFSLGFVEMRAANPEIDPWIPGEDTRIILPSMHLLPDADREGIVINLPEMRLYAFVNGDDPPSTFPLGIGREGLETPIGKTKIVRKQKGPTWRPTERMRKEDPELPAVVPPGPENPLGTHALYLGWPTYAIHGTDKPYGIGRRVSSGCIRLYPENIVELFEMIPVGTPVQVVNQPIKLAWINDVLYLEAHPNMEQAIQMEETAQIYSTKMTDADMQLILKAAGEYKDKLHWAAIRNAVRARSGVPVMIARKRGGRIIDDFEVIDGDDIDIRPEAARALESRERADVDINLDRILNGSNDRDEDESDDVQQSESAEALSEVEKDRQTAVSIKRALNP